MACWVYILLLISFNFFLFLWSILGGSDSSTCTSDTGFYCLDFKDECNKTTCNAGEYRNAETDGLCVGCTIGKFTTDLGLTEERQCDQRCPQGKFSDEKGRSLESQCKSCSEGKWSNRDDGITSDDLCQLCEKGKFLWKHSTKKFFMDDLLLFFLFFFLYRFMVE